MRFRAPLRLPLAPPARPPRPQAKPRRPVPTPGRARRNPNPARLMSTAWRAAPCCRSSIRRSTPTRMRSTPRPARCRGKATPTMSASFEYSADVLSVTSRCRPPATRIFTARSSMTFLNSSRPARPMAPKTAWSRRGSSSTAPPNTMPTAATASAWPTRFSMLGASATKSRPSASRRPNLIASAASNRPA